MNIEFKEDDKIIWDSGFGYEVGYFIGEGNSYHSYKVNLLTGIKIGEISLSINQIKPYSKGLLNTLSKRYGYEKSLK